MERPKHIVGICGGSGSGKTTLVRMLNEKLEGKKSISLLSLDNYYKNIDQQELDHQGVVNFDLPTALEANTLIDDISKLSQGQFIEKEEYTFNVESETPTLVKIEPAEILLVEGLFVMHYPEVFDFLTTKVFIEVDKNTQLERRIKRDMSERGYSEEEILYQWHNHVIPCYENYLHPYKSKADIVISNDSYFENGVDDLVSLLSV